MTILIDLSVAGINTGPFNLYSDADGYVTAFALNVTRQQLLDGYPAVVPNGTLNIKLQSLSDICPNDTILPVSTTTSTTTSTSTSTTSTTTTLNCSFIVNAQEITTTSTTSTTSTTTTSAPPDSVTFSNFYSGTADHEYIGTITIVGADAVFNVMAELSIPGQAAIQFYASGPNGNGTRSINTGEIGSVSSSSFTLPAGVYDYNVIIDINPDGAGYCEVQF
jgi:hypothetical protein